MKCTSILLLALSSMATASMAFAPAQNRVNARKSRAAFVPKNKKGGPLASSFLAENTALNLSDGTSDPFERQLDFLVVDVEKAREDLAKNWGKIVVSGACAMGLGTAAFVSPIFATSVAYDATVLTVAFTGAAGLGNLFFAEQGQKLKYGLSGVFYLALAYTMANNPALGLDVITLSIASVLAAEGVYEIAVAVKNESLQSRPWHIVSGAVSILASVALAVNIPLTSLITPGVALGARLTSSGASKVVIGLAGKDLADANKKSKQ